jgi:hypothetical protein
MGTDMIDFAAVVTDEPVGSGQYRYIATHAWSMASFGTATRIYGAYLGEHLMREWVPVDPRQDWLLERENTDRRQWLVGSAEQAVADGFELRDGWPSGRWRAPYGDFYAADAHREPGPRPGWWQVPTPEFLVGLPRDPQRLHQRLSTDSRDDRPGYTGVLVYALDALRTGLVPADLRAALYRALLMLPGMTIVESAQNLDGVPAVALVHDDGTRRTEVFIDPANGHFIGERDTVTSNTDRGLKAGTVTKHTAVRTATADAIGGVPASVDR